MKKRKPKSEAARESMTITQLERFHLQNKRNGIYVALEEVGDTDFFWSKREIWVFDQYWKTDISLTEIAKEMHRSEMAVFLLAFDRIARGYIQARKNWRIW